MLLRCKRTLGINAVVRLGYGKGERVLHPPKPFRVSRGLSTRPEESPFQSAAIFRGAEARGHSGSSGGIDRGLFAHQWNARDLSLGDSRAGEGCDVHESGHWHRGLRVAWCDLRKASLTSAMEPNGVCRKNSIDGQSNGNASDLYILNLDPGSSNLHMYHSASDSEPRKFRSLRPP